MRYTYIVGILAILALLVACTQTAVQQTQPPAQVPETGNTQTKTFVLTGENFKFLMNGIEAPELRVKQGDRVRIEFTSTSGMHDWTLGEFNAKTERVNTGASSSVEFVADKIGTFEYYCGIMSHRANGMKGKFIVE